MSSQTASNLDSTIELAILGSTAPEIVKLLSARIHANPGELSVLGFLDDSPVRHGETFMGYKVLGGSQLIREELKNALIINNVAKTTAIRRKVWKKIEELGGRFYSAVHPGVDTAFTELGEGVIIQERAILGPDVKIGHQSIVCFGTIVAHESIVEDCCFLAPGVIINGRITVKEGAFIGAGAVIMPNVVVGEWSVVGAGSVVTENVPPFSTVFGAPARVIAYRSPESVQL